MSKDIQVVSFVDGLAVASVEEVEGAVPRTVLLRGPSGFNYVQQVNINQRRASSFTVVSDRSVTVQPGDVLDDVLASDMDVEVLSSRLTNLNGAKVLFGLTTEPTSVTGLLQLAQKVLRVLLTRPGSHKFLRWEGGGLVESLGTTLSAANRSAIAANIARAVSSAEGQIQSEQIGRRVDLSERLLSLTLVGVDFDSANLKASAVLRMTNYLGQNGNIPLTL